MRLFTPVRSGVLNRLGREHKSRPKREIPIGHIRIGGKLREMSDPLNASLGGFVNQRLLTQRGGKDSPQFTGEPKYGWIQGSPGTESGPPNGAVPVRTLNVQERGAATLKNRVYCSFTVQALANGLKSAPENVTTTWVGAPPNIRRVVTEFREFSWSRDRSVPGTRSTSA